jgi:hypothetical protein
MGLTRGGWLWLGDWGVTYWSLNSSLGGSIGVEANARSGRIAAKRDPKVVEKAGVGSSLCISWYALRWGSSIPVRCGVGILTLRLFLEQTQLPSISFS